MDIDCHFCFTVPWRFRISFYRKSKLGRCFAECLHDTYRYGTGRYNENNGRKNICVVLCDLQRGGIFTKFRDIDFFRQFRVDSETGAVTVDRLVMAVDSGVIVNPLTASGQIEGGMTQALGYAVCEEMRYDAKGNAYERDLDRYHIFRADEMPELETIFVETFEPSHPFGVKAVAEIPMDGVAPAVGNAILDAIGVNVDENPVTPERLWRAIKNK